MELIIIIITIQILLIITTINTIKIKIRFKIKEKKNLNKKMNNIIMDLKKNNQILQYYQLKIIKIIIIDINKIQAFKINNRIAIMKYIIKTTK